MTGNHVYRRRLLTAAFAALCLCIALMAGCAQQTDETATPSIEAGTWVCSDHVQGQTTTWTLDVHDDGSFTSTVSIVPDQSPTDENTLVAEGTITGSEEDPDWFTFAFADGSTDRGHVEGDQITLTHDDRDLGVFQKQS